LSSRRSGLGPNHNRGNTCRKDSSHSLRKEVDDKGKVHLALPKERVGGERAAELMLQEEKVSGGLTKKKDFEPYWVRHEKDGESFQK